MTKAELIAEIEGFQKQVAELKRELDLREEGNLDLGLKSPPHGKAGQADSPVSDKTSEHTKTVATPIPVLLAYVDAEQSLQFNNRSYGEWFGSQRQNAWGKHIRKVLGDTTYRKILPRVNAALAGEKQAFEVEVPGPNGETRILETHYVPHLGENGTVLGFDATVLDITERKKAEQAIQESELRLSEILDVAKEAIISVDEEQKIVLFNKGAERIFGSKAQEAIGQRLDILLPEAARTAHRQHLEKFSKGPVDSRQMFEGGEILGQRKNGEIFPAEASISQVKVKGRRVSTVFFARHYRAETGRSRTARR